MSDFQEGVGTNSTGPTTVYAGTGSGYYDGATNIGNACGSSAPNPCFAGGNGAKVSCCGWNSGGTQPGFIVVLYGTLPQNYFSSVALSAPANLNFNSASAVHYSTTDIPGFTAWIFTDSHQFTYIGQNLNVTFSGIVPPVPTPSGQGDITNPYAWETVATGTVPPSEYDGVPGGGNV